MINRSLMVNIWRELSSLVIFEAFCCFSLFHTPVKLLEVVNLGAVGSFNIDIYIIWHCGTQRDTIFIIKIQRILQSWHMFALNSVLCCDFNKEVSLNHIYYRGVENISQFLPHFMGRNKMAKFVPQVSQTARVSILNCHLLMKVYFCKCWPRGFSVCSKIKWMN